MYVGAFDLVPPVPVPGERAFHVWRPTVYTYSDVYTYPQVSAFFTHPPCLYSTVGTVWKSQAIQEVETVPENSVYGTVGTAFG